MEKFIDISKIHNCWIIYLLTGGKDSTENDIEKFQQKCKQNNIFGLGWLDGKIANKYKGKKLNEDNNVEKYVNDNDNQFRGNYRKLGKFLNIKIKGEIYK